MGFFDGLLDKVGLDDIIGAATGAYNTYNNNRSSNQLGDVLRNSEQRNYDNSKQYYDAYSSYLDQLQQVRAANAGASASAAAANRGAAMATEANRQKAAKAGLKLELKGLNKAKGIYEPWMQAGNELLPLATKTASNSMNGMNLLLGHFLRPGFDSRISQSKAAWNTGVPIPDYLKG
jgi:hypothetical protein